MRRRDLSPAWRRRWGSLGAEGVGQPLLCVPRRPTTAQARRPEVGWKLVDGVRRPDSRESARPQGTQRNKPSAHSGSEASQGRWPLPLGNEDQLARRPGEGAPRRRRLVRATEPPAFTACGLPWMRPHRRCALLPACGAACSARDTAAATAAGAATTWPAHDASAAASRDAPGTRGEPSSHVWSPLAAPAPAPTPAPAPAPAPSSQLVGAQPLREDGLEFLSVPSAGEYGDLFIETEEQDDTESVTTLDTAATVNLRKVSNNELLHLSEIG